MAKTETKIKIKPNLALMEPPLYKIIYINDNGKLIPYEDEENSIMEFNLMYNNDLNYINRDYMNRVEFVDIKESSYLYNITSDNNVKLLVFKSSKRLFQYTPKYYNKFYLIGDDGYLYNIKKNKLVKGEYDFVIQKWHARKLF